MTDPNDQPTFLTPAAMEKLAEELEHLKTAGRREMEDRIAEARSHGDLRENADYDAAKNAQGLMEARIRQLEHLIQTAEVRVVEESDTVDVGCVATVVDSDGDEVEYFVAPQENKVPGVLLASPSSPLGAALIGAKVGDQVSYEAPAGTFTVKVVGVRPYQG
jgi:transcription elongation factor GreA